MSDELKPCPFCGGAVYIESYWREFYVDCPTCGCEFHHHPVSPLPTSKSSCITAWNTRADTPDVANEEARHGNREALEAMTKRSEEAERKLGRAMGALCECEAEIDQYIWQEYPLDHPVHKLRRQRDLDANPARAAIAELKGQTND